MTPNRTKNEHRMIMGLREICNMTPPLSIEAEENNTSDPHGARCAWLKVLREVQRLARGTLQAVGEKE